MDVDQALPAAALTAIDEETLFGALNFQVLRITEFELFLTTNERYPPRPDIRDIEVTVEKSRVRDTVFWAVREVGFREGCTERQADVEAAGDGQEQSSS